MTNASSREDEASSPIRIVFMGTGPFASHSLTRLLGWTRQSAGCPFEVSGVVTQPDRAAGRGQRMMHGDVSGMAQAEGIDLLQPQSFKDELAVSALERLRPDVMIVASYGLILPPRALAVASRGCLNLHPSLLPRYRGPSPIPAAILAGEAESGVSVMEMVAKMDAGPIVAQKSVQLLAGDTTESATATLANANARLLLSVLPRWVAGDIEASPQDDASATYTAMLTKRMGRIDWAKPAAVLEREVRAFIPWPVSHTEIGESLKVWRASVGPGDGSKPPGTILAAGGTGLSVQTGDGALRLLEVQPAGGKRMSGVAFALGRQNRLASAAV